MIKKHKRELKGRFHLKSIGVFGSHSTGTSTSASDVDVLVEYLHTVDMFEFLDLKEYLENLLGKKVDLVTKRALKPAIKKAILDQVSYV